jgi:hypothetical protein
MGDLITQTPYSEVTSTLEIMDRWGVKREHLERYRKASSWFQQQVAKALISGREDFFSGPIPHAIDCDADPFIPEGWKVEEHTKGGIFTWDPTAVKLYLSKKQKGDKRIVGNDLHKELKSKPVLNANALDYLLKPENQHLIPEEWKGKAVFFWGTIYRRSYVYLCVRCLYWNDGAWGWSGGWLGGGFDSYGPAVVRVIPSGDLA